MPEGTMCCDDCKRRTKYEDIRESRDEYNRVTWLCPGCIAYELRSAELFLEEQVRRAKLMLADKGA